MTTEGPETDQGQTNTQPDSADGITRRSLLKLFGKGVLVGTTSYALGYSPRLLQKPILDKVLSFLTNPRPDKILAKINLFKESLLKTPQVIIVDAITLNPSKVFAEEKLAIQEANTKFIVGPEIPSERKFDANILAEGSKQVIQELGLDGLIGEVEITRSSNLKLIQAAENYGHNFKFSPTEDGVHAIFSSGKDKTSKIYINVNTPEGKLEDIMRHELSHSLDPRFDAFNFLLTDWEIQEIKDRYGEFLDDYKQKGLLEGKPFTWYDQKIQYELFREAGDKAKPVVLQNLRLTQFLQLGIPQEALKRNLIASQNMAITLIVQKYLEDPGSFDYSTGYMTTTALGQKIGQKYWEEGDSFLNIFGEDQAYLKEVLDGIEEKSEIEMWAEMGKLFFSDPAALKEAFPKFYDTFNFIYQKVRSKLQ